MNFETFENFYRTDRVVVMDRLGHTQAVFDNPIPIAELILLLEEYADGWDLPDTGVPIVERYYYFYAGDRPLGHVGLGEGVLVLHYAGGFWARMIGNHDFQELLSAIQALDK